MYWPRLGLMAVFLGLAGCAGQGPVLPQAELSTSTLLSGDRLDVASAPTSSGNEWLTVDEAMRAFLEQLELRGSTASRIAQLLAAVRDHGDQPFSYQVDATLTASQAFHARTGNCMAFSAMMVSLLREAGLQASFQRVEVVPEWEFWGDETSVAGQHINTRVSLPNGQGLVVDWGGTEGVQRRVTPLDDAEARAEFHNNLGVNSMIAGDHGQALAEFRAALELAPGLAHVWSNLAVLYNRRGDESAAESAWLQALEQEPTLPLAMSGLRGLYERQGRQQLADELATALARTRMRDPFWHYVQARRAAHQGDWKNARRRLETALSLRRHERFEDLLEEVRQQERAL